ncbi:MAG TPA: flavin reductase family protein [Alphaproteobacteria bacterium]|nr:flavin reductase family protein [Alphaproteobacteria bacterium]
MFFPTDRPHGLPHNPFNALVQPRPIGWISSMDAEGRVNLAPYSFFNAVAYTPPQVMFAATGPHAEGGYKDSVANIEATGEFVVNIATWALREAMNLTAAPAPHDVDEFGVAGLTATPAALVKVPWVAESPAHLECLHTQTVHVLSDSEEANVVVFGRVVGIHIDDAVLIDGMVDYRKLDAIARLGYMDYARTVDIFSMRRPGWPVEKS